MEPEEPWEALEIEFEDSIIVPCKRKNSLSPTKISKISKPNNPFLGACSLKSQSQSQSEFRSNSKPLIPGPAGAVQSAMQRKILMGVGEEPISTQEYIRRAVEDPCLEDDDFYSDPWLFAVDYVRRQGLMGTDGAAIGTPLSEIKSGINANKVSQIVAIVKSATPNGLGDVMVTLKDPTGIIDASIHRRVLTEGEFGKDISVGAVLILQKVAIFSPSRSVRCLNITLSNVVKVISKDTETTLKQNYPALMVKHTAPDGESSEKPSMSPKKSSLSQGKVEGIMNHLRQNTSIRESVQNTKETEKANLSNPIRFYGSGGTKSRNSVVEKEPLVVRPEVVDGTKEIDATGINDNALSFLLDEQSNTSNKAARTGGIMNHLRQNASVSESLQNFERMEKVNLAPPSIFSGGLGRRSQNSVQEKESLVGTQDDVDRTIEVAVGTGSSAKAKGILLDEQTDPSNQAVSGNLFKEYQSSRNFGQVAKSEENGNMNGVKNRRQLLISKGSISQWTDEQLDELLIFD